MSAERHISVTIRYVKPVNGVAVATFGPFELISDAVSFAMGEMNRHNVWQATVSETWIDRKREAQMHAADALVAAGGGRS